MRSQNLALWTIVAILLIAGGIYLATSGNDEPDLSSRCTTEFAREDLEPMSETCVKYYEKQRR